MTTTKCKVCGKEFTVQEHNDETCSYECAYEIAFEEDNKPNRCKAITESQTRCAHNATKNGYCMQHFKIYRDDNL